MVPVDGQRWNRTLHVTERDGRLYGRGTADMKGFLACVLAAVPDTARRQLGVPIHLAFSYDEEIGCLGVRPMIAEFGCRLVKPRMVVVGEPTIMSVVDSHKGPVRWHIEIKGRAAHSSMAPLGVNAIAVAGKLLRELADIEHELKLRAAGSALRSALRHAAGDAHRRRHGDQHRARVVPLRTSTCARMPGVDIAAIDRRIRAFAANVCLPEMRGRAGGRRSTSPSPTRCRRSRPAPARKSVALALKLAGQNETHAVSYATEAGLFQVAGSPAVVFGPGDIAQAHTADEWIADDQLDKCSAFLARLGDWAEHGSAVR